MRLDDLAAVHLEEVGGWGTVVLTSFSCCVLCFSCGVIVGSGCHMLCSMLGARENEALVILGFVVG